MPWHTDPCRWLSVVVSGERLDIEYRSTGVSVPVQVKPGMAEWDNPEPAEYRGINAGSVPYEVVVVFFLRRRGPIPSR